MAKKSENILILGLGGVGYYLAKRLTAEGHAVTAIEPDADLLRRADIEIDARLIRGNAMSFDSWTEAHAERMDVLIAVTNNGAVNIVASQIAHRLGIPRKIARVRQLELWRGDVPLTAGDLNIDLLIRPEELAAQEIVRLLQMRAGNIVIDIAEGQMKVMATRVDEGSALANLQLKEIGQKYKHFHFRIVAVARDTETIIPGGDDRILPRDDVYILAHEEDFDHLMTLAGASEKHSHRVLIMGGGEIGTRVAELLEGTFPMRLLERDERRAEELSQHLRRTEVLHGDGAETDTLLQAGLLDMDTLITATEDNETNIMTAMMARNLFHKSPDAEGRGRTITLVKREEYLMLASAMGSDVVLNKKVLAANEIFKTIRRGKLLSVAHLHGCDAEVVELIADEGAPIAGKPLYDVDELKDGGIIIGGICRRTVWEIAVGPTVIQPGDRVIGICPSNRLTELQRLLLK